MLNGEIKGADSAIIKCTLADDTEIIFDGENIEENGLTITASIAGSKSIQIGATVMKVATLNIIDIAGKYKNTDFRKAVFNIDIINSDTTYHKGKYIYYSSTRNNGRIKFELRDYMQRTEKKFNSMVVFPTTFGTLMKTIAQDCNFTLGFNEFRNSDVTVLSMPEEATYRNIINYIAQTGGYYAEFDKTGELAFKDYKKTAADTDIIIDDNKMFEHAESPVTITGVAVIIDETRYMSGSDEYVIELSENPFITKDNVEGILDILNKAIVGMSYYSYNARIHSDIRIELGDRIKISDYRNNIYPVMVMSLTYSINQNETLSGIAESEEENENSGTDLLTKIIRKTTNAAQQIVGTYDKVLSNMTELISQGFGMYISREQLSDGSYINYMHDKPALADSTTIWKLTGNGLLVSKDGGTSWAIDNNGNALFETLTARVINAVRIQLVDNNSYIACGDVENPMKAPTILDKDGIHANRYYGTADQTSSESVIFNGFCGGNRITDDLLKVSGNTVDGEIYTCYIDSNLDRFSIDKPCYFQNGVMGIDAGEYDVKGKNIKAVDGENEVGLTETYNYIKKVQNDITGGGNAYYGGWENGSTTLKASTNTMIFAFDILQTGTYMFVPNFRTTVPSGHIFSVGIFTYTGLQYPVTQYQDICTMIGTGKKHSMNGVQVFNATAGKRYYIMGYATSAITIDSLNWYHVYCLKTT